MKSIKSLKNGAYGFGLFLTLTATLAFAKGVEGEKPWHLPLDLTSHEYQVLNAARAQKSQGQSALSVQDDPAMQNILTIGARNLQWVETINHVRPKERWILLSTPETQHAYPMDKPSIYNRDIVLNQFEKRMSAISPSIVAVLKGTGTLPSVPPVSDQEFTKTAVAINDSYQIASRWLMMAPYLEEMAADRASDVRGYYFLTQMPDRQQKLRGYADLSADDQTQIRTWLLQMCYNTKTDDQACAQELNGLISTHADLNSLYDTYAAQSAKAYNDFFVIPEEGHRTDMSFANTQGVETFTIPFVTPSSPRILSFVKDNVEAEWTQPDSELSAAWALKLNMVSVDDGKTPHVEFETGATPHVNALAGNIITMDQNSSLDDYDNNWTIRHEFGHVLGFPDCYIEFYDTNQKVIVNYQLDITNLMCSRRGHIQVRHYRELKRVYGH